MPGLGDFSWQDSPTTDAHLAAAEILETYARRYRANGNFEDLARELLPIVRVMAKSL